ncbi:unnamed protein product [Urochloa decumbens]|uniref:Uncharacterized protein n=1 Tax=Urochloa decumbens TaxID=240449 RepID=A0ABC8XSZ5_9POAL
MASKSIASPALLLLAMALALAASAHAQAPPPASTPTPAPSPSPSSQSLCPNVLSDIQAFEKAARALVDKIEMIFVPKFMVILDSTLAKFGLLYPGVNLCVCAYNPNSLVSSSAPKIKCVGAGIIV